MTVPHADVQLVGQLLAGVIRDPHALLGAHPARVNGVDGVIVRAFSPDAVRAAVVLEPEKIIAMEGIRDGLFAAFLPGRTLPIQYHVRFRFADGAVIDRGDPYRFMPTIGELDLHLFNEGTHLRLWEMLGAHPRTIDGESGVAFSVWAPNARRVSVVGSFNLWDGRAHPMRALGSSGIWELFVPGVQPGALYKFELVTQEGLLRLKADPVALAMEEPPQTASRVAPPPGYAWRDTEWMRLRDGRDPVREPMLIYEVHLGSWARSPDAPERPLTYRQLAPLLASHVKELGFTHIELLPIAEHPFTGSWGYQVTGYFAPTSRYGSPDDFRCFVDTMHQAGIGVLLDWVPAHFPKDDFALRRFDGTALYEHADPRMGEHPDWGTLIFNYGRTEVREFLIGNALYWLEEFHVDGLRVDAVASMLYLDYSRKPDEWLRNRYGGRENLDAIDFLRTLNSTVRREHPGCVMIAEESTAWPGVTKPAEEGGLGFTFKWNMGWMHDTLKYFSTDPIYRSHLHDQLTFAMMYEHSERFIMPLSHDEVVHLKRSLLDKMPGDEWQRFANLRALLLYMYTRPGKKLLFMGTEIAPESEWNHDVSLDWHRAAEVMRHGFQEYMRALGALYDAHPAFWRDDADPAGFAWIDVADRQNSVLSYVRRGGGDELMVLLNLTPVPREQYRVGAPSAGTWMERISSDSQEFGGSHVRTSERVETEPVPYHGFPQSMIVTLPPLGGIVLELEETS